MIQTAPLPSTWGESNANLSLFALDPTWQKVTTLFPGQTGKKILLAILASAEVIQQILPTCGLVEIAILNCRNLATFAQQIGCGKDTVLRYVKVYQALGILTSNRNWRGPRSTTELSLPLTPYQPSLEGLERLKTLTSAGRKKQQDLARFVRDRYILLYHLPLCTHQETCMEENPIRALLTRTAHLLQKKRVRRIERQVLHDEITEILTQMEKEQLGDFSATRQIAPFFFQRPAQREQPSLWKDPEAHQEDQSAKKNSGRKDLTSIRGDLSLVNVKQPEEQLQKEGDPISNKGDLSLLSEANSGDLLDDKGDLQEETIRQRGDLPPYNGDISAHDDNETLQTGDLQDSDALLSSIDRYLKKDSSQKELELESKSGELWRGSEQELFQEAVRYLKLLDGPQYATPDYLSTHDGKKALGGYKNKIRRSHQFARIAAINTLLQRTFYDLSRQKKPLGKAGKWFHSSFDRYTDQVRPMEITGEILDWVKSPYTLEEIALVIPLERQRQETQWWTPEPLHRPFSSCVALYHHLPGTVSGTRRSLPETIRHAEMSPGRSANQRMNEVEAEHLACEIRDEASWYLNDIQVCPEPHLGENVYVVSASIAETSFPVAYSTRQDWWQDHQQQVKHRAWEMSQKGEICGAHA